MDRPAVEPGDIVDVVDDGHAPSAVGVVIGVVDYSEDSNPSRWEVWVAMSGAGSGMFEPNQVRRRPHARIADLPSAELREMWREITRQRDT